MAKHIKSYFKMTLLMYCEGFQCAELTTTGCWKGPHRGGNVVLGGLPPCGRRLRGAWTYWRSSKVLGQTSGHTGCVLDNMDYCVESGWCILMDIGWVSDVFQTRVRSWLLCWEASDVCCCILTSTTPQISSTWSCNGILVIQRKKSSILLFP